MLHWLVQLLHLSPMETELQFCTGLKQYFTLPTKQQLTEYGIGEKGAASMQARLSEAYVNNN